MSEQTNSPQNQDPDEMLSENLGEESMNANSDDNIITFKRSHLYAALIPLAFLTGLAFGYLFWGRDATGTSQRPFTVATAAPTDAQEQAVAQNVEPTPEFQRYDVPEDDDPVWGPDEAAITIIEFSDYECPYCRKWHVEVWPQLQAEYGDQIRLVYRDFPLTTIHSNANSAALAANCALEQGLYWEYNDKLFGMEFNLGKSTYQTYAEELGMDMDAFNECLESGRYVEEVNADYQYAANLGIRSTPTFFVNGIPVVGAQPFDVFKSLIDQELAGEIPQ